VDAGFLKVFRMTERMNCKFRAETFSAVIRSLYDPNTDPTALEGHHHRPGYAASWRLALKIVF
jgi:hypothetical protein